jgi:hypothetical protein
MSDAFAADWLALREPCDAAAVDPALVAELAAWAAPAAGLKVVDLGAGTGAAYRRLARHLACPQRWTLIEHDPALIDAGRPLLPDGATYHRLDLAHDLAVLADLRPDLITASALLDLVSAAWLERLVAVVHKLKAGLYVTLIYDGHVDLDPADPVDAEVVAAFNQHQRFDKGFGPALGPAAASCLAEGLRNVGMEPRLAVSPWRLGPGEAALQRRLLDGYAAVAVEVAPTRAEAVRAWHRRRQALLDAGAGSLMVGHHDLLVLPGRVPA